MANSANQEQNVSKTVNMDAGKLLRTINEGVGATLNFFSNQIKSIGKKNGKNFELKSLHKSSLVYEDVDTHKLFTADIKKHKNRYFIQNAKQIIVTESEKSETFSKFCSNLVEAIDSEDFSRADQVFAKIEASKFRSKVIPESGYVKTRDGNVHFIKVEGKYIPEDKKSKIISAIVESIAERYDVTSNGNIVSAFFSDTDKIVFPINEMARRRVIAKNMKVVAESAYKKDGFNEFIKGVASLISKHKLEEAVEKASKFLREYQEFCLLNKAGLENLVENSLFANGIFNSILTEHTAELVYRTNLKVNKDSIIESWSKVAQKAEDISVISAVETLKESTTFEKDYDKFLESVLNETVDTDMTQMALQFARSSLASQGEAVDNDTIEHIDNLLARLKKNETADKAVRDESEEILAGVSSELLGRVSDLGNFDKIPAAKEEDELVAPEGAVDETEADTDLGLDIGGEDLGGEDLGGEDLDLGGEDLGEAEEISLESKKAVVASLTEQYTKLTTNFKNVLAEDGTEGVLAAVDSAVAKAKKVGELADEIKSKWLELQKEVASIAPSTGTELAIGATAETDDYTVGCVDATCEPGAESETEVDFASYTGEAEDEESEDEESEDEEAEGEESEGEGEESEGEESEGEDSEKPDFLKGKDSEVEEEETDEEEIDETEDKKAEKKAEKDAKRDIKAEEADEAEEMDEDQYKWPTHRHGQGKRAGLGRSSINPVKESLAKGSKFQAALGTDGNYWLFNQSLNEAVCLGDGMAEFEFDLSDPNGYRDGAKQWLSGIVANNNLAEQLWKKATLVEGELPDFLKSKEDKKEDKKDSKEVEETHETGMHGKSNTAEKMVGGDKKPAKPNVKMESAKCPNCGSTDIAVNESIGEATCGGCEVKGKPAQFAITEKVVDPKSSEYDSKADAKKWGDGEKRNKEPKVVEGDDEGTKGVKAAPKSKEPEAGKVEGQKEIGGEGYMWKK